MWFEGILDGERSSLYYSLPLHLQFLYKNERNNYIPLHSYIVDYFLYINNSPPNIILFTHYGLQTQFVYFFTYILLSIYFELFIASILFLFHFLKKSIYRNVSSIYLVYYGSIIICFFLQHSLALLHIKIFCDMQKLLSTYFKMLWAENEVEDTLTAVFFCKN